MLSPEAALPGRKVLPCALGMTVASSSLDDMTNYFFSFLSPLFLSVPPPPLSDAKLLAKKGIICCGEKQF